MSKDSKKLTEELLEDEDSGDRGKDLRFKCPICGKISQKDVLFLCNTCSREDLVYKDGVYMCPSCLEPGENFECLNCGSKEVTLLENIALK